MEENNQELTEGQLSLSNELVADLRTHVSQGGKFYLYQLYSYWCRDLGVYDQDVSVFVKNLIRDTQDENIRILCPENLAPVERIVDSQGVSLPSVYRNIFNNLVCAILDQDLIPTKSGLFRREDVMAWVEQCSIDFPFFATKHPLPSAAVPKPAQPETEPNGETPTMQLIRKGWTYWWGGLNPEHEYRADSQQQMRDWFIEQGNEAHLDVSAGDATAFAKAISPTWATKGPRPNDKVRVPFPQES